VTGTSLIDRARHDSIPDASGTFESTSREQVYSPMNPKR
jgi:hypothetical protein